MAIENTYLLGKNITLGCGFDLQAKAPLDSRQTVPSTAGLQALINGDAAYEGMIVYDEESKKTYQAQKCDSYTVEVDGKTKTYDITFREFGINESELRELIASETTAAMEFKGVTATLPENPAKGDMYKVAGENINIKIDDVDAKVGDSIVYNGEQWFLIPSGDDIEDTWRPVTDVNNDAALTFAAGDKLDVSVSSTGEIKYSHEAIAAPTDKTAEGDEKTRTYITAVETDGFGHITGYKTATENVEDTNTTYTFEGLPVEEGDDAPSSVYFQVTSSEEGASTEVIYLDAYNKNEADAAFKAKRAEKLDAVATDANVFVDTIAQDENGDITITTKAVDFSAITDRLDELEKVDHDHDNKTVLDGITSDKIATWDKAKTALQTIYLTNESAPDDANFSASNDYLQYKFVDNYGSTQNDRAIELDLTQTAKTAIDNAHTHTFADTDVEDAIAKKHSHTFVEAELNKIADGDVEKWNAAYTHSQADHAPVDAQANIIESVKVNGTALTITDKAVDITVPTGALASKDKVAKTDLAEALATEINNKVASVTAGDASVTIGGTATAPTVAAKISADEGNALTLAEDGLKVIIPESTKVEASETNGNIKVDGAEVTVYTHPDKHAIADIDGLQDALDAKVAKTDYEADKATFATKTELGDVDKKFADYKTAADQKAIDDEQDRRLGVLEGASATHATKDELNGVDAKFANYTNTTDMNTKFDLKADKTQVATDIATAKDEAIAEASNQDAVILAEAQKYADDAVQNFSDAISARNYADQDFVTSTVESGNNALKEELQKEIDDDVKALADTVYTKTEIENLMTWGEF